MFIKKISNYYKEEINVIDKIIHKFLQTLTPEEKMELLDMQSVLQSVNLQLKKGKIIDKINFLSEKLNLTFSDNSMENIVEKLKTFLAK